MALFAHRFILATSLMAAASLAAQTTPLTFPGTTAVGSASTPVVVTLTAQATGTIGSLTALTGGSANLDFTLSPLTCAVGVALVSGQTCTVSVTFSPQYPGVRQGAVVATSGGVLLASSPLSGVALGSLPVLNPGTINTVAGNGDWIYRSDGIAAVDAPIFLPSGLAVDGAGDLYLCDTSNHRIRRVDAATGYISTVAGNGNPGGSGDGGLATSAQLNSPSGIAIDGGGNFYIADTGNNVVRRVDAVSGTITTFAGQMGSAGYSGDGGPATGALLVSPRGLALLPGGDLVIADSGNNAVRVVNITSDQIRTVAGTGVPGYNGDGIAATTAELNDPFGVAARADGAIAIADLENQRVRLVNTSGVISTALGTGQRNGGSPVQEQLDGPTDVAFDPAGDLLVTDAGNNRIRSVLASDGSIQTIVGTSSEQFAGDGGPANQASIYGPYALVFDEHGNLWLTDTFHNRVREITGSLLDLTYATIKVGNVSPPMVEALANYGNADLVLGSPVLTQAALDTATTTCGQAAMPPATSCNMGVEFAPTSVGSNITGSIHWPSNAPNVTPIDSLRGVVLSVNVTSVRVTSSVNPAALGSAVTFTATVNSLNPNITGTVTFTEGATTWCASVTLTAQATATCVVSSLSLGSHVINASYSGDADDAPSSSAGYTEVVKQRPALVLSASPNPAISGSSVLLTLTAVDTTGVPTGSVVFYDGSTSLGSALLNGAGVAQWNAAGLITGSHSLSAQYGGDSANLSGTSNTVGETINQASTATALAESAANTPVGSPVTFTATVTNANGPAITGSVTFKDGTTVLGTQTLSAGTAAITVATLTPGSHNMTASYSGDSNNSASSSTVQVENILQISTVVSLTSNATIVNAGAALQLTANAAVAPGFTPYGPLTGSVTFKDGSVVLATVSINTSGLAAITTSSLGAGNHTLTASFTGNANYAASTSSSLSITVQQTSTQTVLSAASPTTLAGTPATWSVVVSSASGIPTGQVVFLDGTIALATATLNASGTATVSTSSLAHGIHAISAFYNGDGNYLSSASAVVDQVVQLAAPVVTLSGPVSVKAGLKSSFAAALTAPGVAPTGAINLLDGSAVIATATVSGSGSYSFANIALAVGTHAITARYSGDTDNAASLSVPLSVAVQLASPTVTLSAPTAVKAGLQASFVATLTSTGVAPTGTLDLMDGSSLIGTAAVTGTGNFSFANIALAVGTHAITASYNGDANNTTAVSAAATVLVQLASPTVTLNGPASPVVAGLPAAFSGTITGPGVPPTGAIALTDGATVIATNALIAGGNFSFSTSGLTVGTHAIAASYSGDADNSAAASPVVTVVVQQASANVTLMASANPLIQGNNLSLTATVTTNSPGASGQVRFLDGSTMLGAATLDNRGTASLSTAQLSAGAHLLTAVYSGDANHAGCTSQALRLVVLNSSSVVLTSSNNPSASGQAVVFSVSLNAKGGVTPTGTVSLADNGSPLATEALDSNGTALFQNNTLTVGAHTITVTYPGDVNFTAASAQLTQTVLAATTTITLAGPPSPATYGKTMNLTATVASNGTAAAGSVAFSDGGQPLGTATLNSGSAVLTLAPLAPGPHTFVAVYSGDQTDLGSKSAPLSLTVKQNTQLVLTSNGNPALTLTPISITATITNASASPATGAVSFTLGGNAIGSAVIDALGHATINLPAQSPGSYAIAASYAGDGSNFPSNSAAYSEGVQLRTTTTAVTGSAGNPSDPKQITLIAVVGSQGPVPPGGAVTFSNGSTSLGQAPLNTGGVALLTTTFTQATEQISVSYSGDANYAASQSTTAVNAGTLAAAPQFVLAVSTPAVTLVTSQHTTLQVTIASVTGFSDTIALGCLGLPHAGTCTFSPSRVVLSANGTATATLIVDTGNPLGSGPATTASLALRRGPFLCWLPIGLLAGALRRRRGMLAGVSALLLLGGLLGCSGLSTANTPPGSYNIQVVGTGQATGVSENQILKLVVTQ